MLEFLFTLPFITFMFLIKYLGSLLVWVGIVVWVYQKRDVVFDWFADRWFDLMYWFRNRKKSTKNDEKPEDYIV
jgi:hypothetical protein